MLKKFIFLNLLIKMNEELINEIQYWSYYRIDKEINRLTRLHILYNKLLKEYKKNVNHSNENEDMKYFTILQEQLIFTLRQLKYDLNINYKLNSELNETLYLGDADVSERMENKIAK